jgi:uncharacterized protein (TIGR02246 family)
MPIQTPEETHSRFADGVNRRDAASLVDLYAPDAAIVERDGTLTTGADAVRHHLDELVAMAPVMEIVDSRAFTHGDVALLCSKWRATVTTPDGERTMEFRGSEVLRRQSDGTWALALDNPWGVEVAAG